MTGESTKHRVDGAWRAAYIVAYRLLRVWWFFRRPLIRGAFVAVWPDNALLVIRNSYRPEETLSSDVRSGPGGGRALDRCAGCSIEARVWFSPWAREDG